MVGGERARHEMYEESCRRYAEAQQQALAWEWIRFHEDQAARHQATLEALIASHETAAARLMEPEPKGETA